MNPLTEARQAISAALQALGVTVYGAPPTSMTTPAAVVGGGVPWAEPLTWARTRTSWVVTLCATQLDAGEGSYERLEQLTWDSVKVLRAQGFLVGQASQPRSTRYGQAEVAAVDLEVTVQVDDDDATKGTP